MRTARKRKTDATTAHSRIPSVNEDWKESDLGHHWFTKVLEVAGYGSTGLGTFRTERRVNGKGGLARQDFTLFVNSRPLIHVELKRPSVRLEREHLSEDHFLQAHRYAVSHYVCKNDEYVTPMGVLTNGKLAYLFDGSIERPEKALQRSLLLDLTKPEDVARLLGLIDVDTIQKNGGYLKNEVIDRPVVQLNRAALQGADSWLSQTLIGIYKDMRACKLDERESFTATITFFLTAILRDCGYIPTEQLMAFEEAGDWISLVKTLEFHLRSPLNALYIPEELHNQAFKFYSRTQFLPVRLDVFPADGLGRAYEDLLHHVKGNEARTSYYTPRELIDGILSELKITKTHRVLDPCTGSSAFLTSCVERCFRLGAEHDPREIKKYIETKLVGVDKDWFAVQVSKAALTAIYARYLPDEAVFRAPKSNIFECDFFEFDAYCKKAKVGLAFDRIVGNPPWGDHLHWLDQRFHGEVRNYRSYRRQTCVSIYVYEKAITDFLKPNGQIGMVLKHELIDGASHDRFRDFLTTVGAVVWDYGRKKLFTNNSQAIVAFGKKNHADAISVIPKDATAIREQFSYDGAPLKTLFAINQGFGSGCDEIYEVIADAFPKDKNTKPLIAPAELAPFTTNKFRNYYFIRSDEAVPNKVTDYCRRTKITRTLKKSKNRKEHGPVNATLEWHLFQRAELVRKKRESYAWLWVYNEDAYFSAPRKIFTPRFPGNQERLNATAIYDNNVITKTDTTVFIPLNPKMSEHEFRFILAFLNTLAGFRAVYAASKQAGGETVAAFPEYIGEVRVPQASEEEMQLISVATGFCMQGDLSHLPILDRYFFGKIEGKAVSAEVMRALRETYGHYMPSGPAPEKRHREVEKRFAHQHSSKKKTPKQSKRKSTN